MTVGKDVSALFPDVVNCMQTDNLELKKLVYLYLMNYAKSQPDMAIMAVNTFVKVNNPKIFWGVGHFGPHPQLLWPPNNAGMLMQAEMQVYKDVRVVFFFFLRIAKTQTHSFEPWLSEQWGVLGLTK